MSADTAFVEVGLKRRIDYVDISAPDEFHREVVSLDDLATSACTTAFPSVGLSPGMTNVMASIEKQYRDEGDFGVYAVTEER